MKLQSRRLSIILNFVCAAGHSLLIADMLVQKPKPFEFSLNVFIEFSEFSEKNICHYSKRARMCHPVSSVTHQDATTVPSRHMCDGFRVPAASHLVA